MYKVIAIAAAVTVLFSCKPGNKGNGTTTGSSDTAKTVTQPAMKAPDFNADSAYMYVQKQVDFGPRVPGTDAHARCALYLYNELKKYTDKVSLQQGQGQTFDNKIIPIKNIIGEINPDAPKRILLFAHWDSRPFADADTKDKDKPILGANDGASGVGVLLEIARQLHIKRPEWGVDIIFFDAEDWGSGDVNHSFCLGSQYWGRTPHKPNYKATYGIGLDMVGAPNATFLMEGFSKQVAGEAQQKIWQTANKLGYYNYFMFTEYGAIIDDHYYVNNLRGIPAVDIIHLKPGGGFGDFWHTHNDNMSVIDRNTLRAVGETLLAVIYSEKNS